MGSCARVFLSLWCLFFSAGITQGQEVASFELVNDLAEVSPDTSFSVILRASLDGGWHLYSMDLPAGGPIPTKIWVEESDVFLPNGDPRQPEPIPWFDKNFDMETSYFEGTVDFEVPVHVKASAPAGRHELTVKVRFMVCNDSSCLPPQTRTFSELISVSGELGDGKSGTEGGSAGGLDESNSANSGGLPAGTWAYIWFAMTMGALALLTPCVFPMIPITVSYFTKRDAQTRGRAIFEAAVYSLGIVATFTLIGFALTFMFGAGGINKLAASPLVNALIALVFVLFALSLFGVVELRLPSSWLSAVDRKSSQSKGIVGILLMSLTFSLTSFTCTVPFVGTVMVAALQGDLMWSLIGVTSFAAVFSLPFFLLALFPSWLQSLPRSGNWMNSVKVTMGFLELAAAMKFISNVDLVYQWEWITRPVFITVWLAIGLITSGYLLGWFHFKHETPSESMGAGRVMFAILFLAVSLYLFRGLFGFPLGELDAFLPPRDYGEVGALSRFAGPASGQSEVWHSDYASALQEAKREGRPIFVDFTGYTCTNCRWMESNIFPLPEVQALFQEFVLARLYTDGGEPEHDRNQAFEQERFGTIALPYYAIISPEDSTLATFPGLTRDEREFVEFLNKGLNR
jgi:thiol:disulfide interchange protein DsbD